MVEPLELASLPAHLQARVIAALPRLEDEEGPHRTRTNEVCRLWRDLTYQTMGSLDIRFDGELADSFLVFDDAPRASAAERLFARCAPWLASLTIRMSAGGLAAAAEHAAALAIVGAAGTTAPALRTLSLHCQTWGNGGALFAAALACTQLARLDLPFCPLPEHPPPAPAAAAATWLGWLGLLAAAPRLQALTMLDFVAPFFLNSSTDASTSDSTAAGPAVPDLAAALGALTALTCLELRRLEESSLAALPGALLKLPRLRLLALHLGEGMSPSRAQLTALAALEEGRGVGFELHLVCHPTRTVAAHWEPLSQLGCLRRLEAHRWSHCPDPVPPSVWQAAALTALVLRGADLASIPPALELPALRGLTLLYFSPAPDGALPPQLPRQLPGLTALALRRAARDHDPRLRLPPGFAAALPRLARLELCGCSLAAVPQEVSALRTLRTLLLRFNELRGLPAGGFPPSLRHLDLTGNPLSRIPPAMFRHATALTHLDLSECRLDAAAVAAVESADRTALPLLRVLRTGGQQEAPSLSEMGRRVPGAAAAALLAPFYAAAAGAGAAVGLGEAVWRALAGRRFN